MRLALAFALLNGIGAATTHAATTEGWVSQRVRQVLLCEIRGLTRTRRREAGETRIHEE